MSRWYRVFGSAAEQPRPEELLEVLRTLGVTAPVRVRGDEDGWTALEVVLAEGAGALAGRVLPGGETGIRAELNTWAAWLETCGASRTTRP